MAVRTTTLASGSFTGTTQAAVLTCPAGHVYIVKQSNLLNDPTGVAAAVHCYLVNGTGDRVTFDQMGASNPGDFSNNFPLFAVLIAGDHLDLSASAAGKIGYWFGGADLLL